MKVNFCLVFLILSFVGSVAAQESNCAIHDVMLDCPSEYFKEVKVDDKETRIYKYAGKGKDMFFFATVPSKVFDAHKIGDLVLKSSSTNSKPLEWKVEKDPLIMSTRTKYKYDLVASLGLSSSKLLEVKGFVFAIDGKKVVLGYVSDLSEDNNTNQRRFKAGQGYSDNASGCNAVVTALNSVTKEFKDKNQYCFLSAFGASK